MTQQIQRDLPRVPNAMRNVLGGTFKSWIDVVLFALLVGALLWCLFIVSPRPAVAKASSPLGPPARSAAPPWSGPSGFPPPRPFGSTMRPWIGDAAKRMAESMRSVVTRPVPPPSVRRATTPARIARARGVHVPVVAKVATPTDVLGDSRSAHPSRHVDIAPIHAEHAAGADAAAGAQHKSATVDSRSLLVLRHRDHWIVMPGDTLWDIAASHLGTNNASRIARYWPLIHRANRGEIGSDPSLIRPGQVLELPREMP